MNGKRERILALDLLRGLFLVVIIVDHLSLFPNLFELGTGRGYLWSSAAEGFFLISGTLVGYIYGPRMRRSPITTSLKIWKRAAELYVCSIISTFAFVWWGNRVTSGAKPGLWINPQPAELIEKVLTMQYVYGWTDFLNHYVIYMIAAPLAVYLLAKRKAWLVFIASLLVWLNRGMHMDMAWQLLFMGGVIFGYYLPAIQAKTQQMSQYIQRLSARLIYVMAGAVFVCSMIIIRLPEIIVGSRITSGRLYDSTQVMVRFHEYTLKFFDKNTLGLGRVVVSFLWFGALFVFFRRNEKRIGALSLGIFRRFGQASLYVYVVHAIAIFALHLFMPVSIGLAGNTIVTVIVIAAIYQTIALKEQIVAQLSALRKHHLLVASQHSSLLRLATYED